MRDVGVILFVVGLGILTVLGLGAFFFVGYMALIHIGGFGLLVVGSIVGSAFVFLGMALEGRK